MTNSWCSRLCFEISRQYDRLFDSYCRVSFELSMEDYLEPARALCFHDVCYRLHHRLDYRQRRSFLASAQCIYEGCGGCIDHRRCARPGLYASQSASRSKLSDVRALHWPATNRWRDAIHSNLPPRRVAHGGMADTVPRMKAPAVEDISCSARQVLLDRRTRLAISSLSFLRNNMALHTRLGEKQVRLRDGPRCDGVTGNGTRFRSG